MARTLLVIVALLLIGGCAVVPAYRRSAIVDAAMDPNADAQRQRAIGKMRLAREGAAGGDGLPAGGGCACSN